MYMPLYIVHTSICSVSPYFFGIYIYIVPSKVSVVAVSKAVRSGRPALRVTWTAPQSNVTISQYQVQYKKRSTDWRAANPVSPGSATSTLLEALDAGTVYKVRIRAVSAIGTGTWSEVQSETTYMGELCSEFKLLESTNFVVNTGKTDVKY